MKIIKSVSQLQKIALEHIKDGDEIGLVPTMGALHEGHVSLIDKSVRNDDITIVSIFVNPTQFGKGEDYLKYPRPFAKDAAICKKNHVDYLFAPAVEEMFPQNYKTFITVEKMQDLLCGAFRKGHFRGVATVVAKLFNITLADRAYFGMKDFQQLKIIEQLAKDLNFRTKVVPCPIIREKGGLALSSRNSYLDVKEKECAFEISKALQKAQKSFKSKSLNAAVKEAVKKISKIPGSKIDYIEALDADTLAAPQKTSKKIVVAAAVWIGKTRLIDNIVVKV